MLDPGLTGYRQMAIDEALYTLITPLSRPVLRFYTWANPTLSLGFFQNYKKVVNRPFCVHNNIDVVRRITGGRAVLHDTEVTYAVIAPLNQGFENQSLRDTYQLIAKALHQALLQFGVEQSAISFRDSSPRLSPGSSLPQCFTTVGQYEIASQGKKMIGSAQKRSRDGFLQHGSILVDFRSALQQGCLLNPDPAIENRIATQIGRAHV